MEVWTLLGILVPIILALVGALWHTQSKKIDDFKEEFEKWEMQQAQIFVSHKVEVENRLAALELQRKAEEELQEKRYNKTMRVLSAMMWALKTGECDRLDPDSLFSE